MKILFIEPGSPWENGYIESFNGKLRDELLEREAFDTLLEANGALRTVAAALQHDPTAQCLGIPAPGAGGVAAPCVRFGYAEQAHGAGLLEVTFSPFIDPAGMLGFLLLTSPERVGFLDGKEAFQ